MTSPQCPRLLAAKANERGALNFEASTTKPLSANLQIASRLGVRRVTRHHLREESGNRKPLLAHVDGEAQRSDSARRDLAGIVSFQIEIPFRRRHVSRFASGHQTDRRELCPVGRPREHDPTRLRWARKRRAPTMMGLRRGREQVPISPELGERASGGHVYERGFFWRRVRALARVEALSVG